MRKVFCVLVTSQASNKLDCSCLSASQECQGKIPFIEAVHMPTSSQGQQGLHPDP